jgi:hypothetical protein
VEDQSGSGGGEVKSGELSVLVEHIGQDLKMGLFSYRVTTQGGFEEEARDIALRGFIAEASIAGQKPRKVFFPPHVLKAVVLMRVATR